MIEPIPYPTPTIITVHEQIAQLNSAYMEKLFFLSILVFCYVVYNYLFRFKNEKTFEIGYHLDGVFIVVSSFLLVVSTVYFTGWM